VSSQLSELRKLLERPEQEKKSRGLENTPFEIAKQPKTWRGTYELFREVRPDLNEFLCSCGLDDEPSNRPIVFLIGAGSSDYIGKSLVHLLRRMWQCDVIAMPSTDLLTDLRDMLLPDRRYLWISFSRSGDSPEGVALLERAVKQYPKIKHLVVSCNWKGKMLRDFVGRPQVFGVCLGDVVNDRGLAMTSSFSNMTIFGQCMAHKDRLPEYEAIVGQLVTRAEDLLDTASNLAADLAVRDYRNACFLGSGPLRGAAMESALKVMELTAGNTQTISESWLGFRHGPMAALQEDSLCVCFLSGDEGRRRYEDDLLDEIRAKKLVKTRVLVSCKSQDHTLPEYVLAPSLDLSIPDLYRAPLDVIVGQLLGLFCSLHWELQPDSPSPNGAISRVVNNVTIHA
jgi:tagatose-6-phosphate ketose/aldose isomerase